MNLGAFGDAQRWIRKDNNADIFAKAWLFGYTIVPEKLYTVELPNDDGPYGFHYVLHKNTSGKVVIDELPDMNWKTLDYCQLTESQIKEKYEWSWNLCFAKEVI